jgi:hypothetical protein
VDLIKTALKGVTTGLSVAFDTTLVALVLSVLVMLLMSAVEQMERSQLTAFDGYCRDRVLRPLAREVSRSEEPQQQSLVGLLPDIEAWRQEARDLAQKIAGSLMHAWEKAGQQWFDGLNGLRKDMESDRAQQKEALERFAGERESFRKEGEGLLGGLKDVVEIERRTVHEAMQAERAAAEKMVAHQAGMVQKYAATMVSVGSKLGELVELQHKLEDGLLKAAGSDGLAALLGEVRGALRTLDPALRRIVEKPLEVKVRFTAAAPGAQES